MSSPVTTNSSRLLKRITTMTSRPPRPFRVAILGQTGVGKTAFTVRFVTRRYIGDYDPLLERIYTCQRAVMGAAVDFEVWDTAGINESSKLKEHIRWADAIILMYDVTDRCSFHECSRLKFLVNAHSRSSRRRKTGSDPRSELPVTSTGSLPVVLVANKKDRDYDRMVSAADGAERAHQLGCVSFSEVSVQEDADEIIDVFDELYQTYRKIRKSRPSLAGSLTASKTSLFGGGNSGVDSSTRLQGSSSDDDSGGNGINGGNSNNASHSSDNKTKNGNSHNHNFLNSSSNSDRKSPSTGGGGEGKSSGRRGTFTSSTSIDIPSEEEWIRKARSRRREAVFALN